MANYNNPNMGNLQYQTPGYMSQQAPVQFPYGNNSMLMNNNSYDYMSKMNGSQNLPSNQFLKCRPVSSKEEARACQIDLDGSLWVFTDVGNGKIYTKQINSDGTATFKTYAFTKDENPYNSTQYVTKEEFDKVIQTLMAAVHPTNPQEPVPAQNIPQDQSKALINF